LKLRDVLPREALSSEFFDAKFRKYLDYEVLERITKYDPRFPFKHKNIHIWWALENNIAVGWNENPSTGWSFSIAKVKGDRRMKYCPWCNTPTLKKSKYDDTIGHSYMGLGLPCYECTQCGKKIVEVEDR